MPQILTILKFQIWNHRIFFHNMLETMIIIHDLKLTEHSHHSSMNSHERNYLFFRRRIIIIKCGLLWLISIYPETHTSKLFFQNVSLSIEIQQLLTEKKIGLTTQHIRRIKIAKEKIALQYNPNEMCILCNK